MAIKDKYGNEVIPCQYDNIFGFNEGLARVYKDYKFSYHKKQKNIIKLVFVQQAFGFTSLYLSNILMSKSVTLSNYVRPTSIIIVLLIALMFKDKEKRPTLKQAIGVILIVIGIFLIK